MATERTLKGLDGDVLTEIYGEDEIRSRIQALARELSARFRNEPVACVCVLRGAFMFFSDLVRQLSSLDLALDFIGLSSYGQNLTSKGTVDVTSWFSLDVTGRHLVIVEDIVDSGRSMQTLLEKLKNLPVKSISICTLIDKRENRVCDVTVDYACFSVASGFLVGYGLDYAQKYRQLPAIYELSRAH